MRLIEARNVNGAWHYAKQLLLHSGVRRESRNGPVLEVPGPVTTEFQRPTERVLFDPVRDANPFFHLMEGLWMLAGRNDVAWIEQFNKRMMSYSDDGHTFHAAYGYRWRHHFDLEGGAGEDFTDQIEKAVLMLQDDPTSRRVVIQMWDPRSDLWSPAEVASKGSVPKDLPCNTSIYLKIRDGELVMTVANRSNDIVWGCYGANVVHMSMLQEYLAGRVGVRVGPYHQISDSWHAYIETWNLQQVKIGLAPDLYEDEQVRVEEMVTLPEDWNTDLLQFMEGNRDGEDYVNPFFNRVAAPMRNAWLAYKEKDFPRAFDHLTKMPPFNDWQYAGTLWLERRKMAQMAKAATA